MGEFHQSGASIGAAGRDSKRVLHCCQRKTSAQKMILNLPQTPNHLTPVQLILYRRSIKFCVTARNKELEILTQLWKLSKHATRRRKAAALSLPYVAHRTF
jgi:hypothetical protein